MRHLPWLLAVLAVTLSASRAFANHEPTNTNENGEAALLLSSTSTTTMAVVGGIILTVMMASDSESMEQYLKENAVALQTDLTFGAGSIVDDLSLAFGVADRDRRKFGKLMRENRAKLLELAEPEALTPERARKFIAVLLSAATDAKIASIGAS